MTRQELRDAVRRLPSRSVLALTVWGEARGEPVEGQVAVAWVIKNRAASRRQTIQTVCLAKWQFSCWWEDSANARLLAERAEAMLAGRILPEPKWLELLQRCHQVLVGAIPDPTGGATFYCSRAFLDDPANEGSWFVKAVNAETLVRPTVVGRHVFFFEAPSASRA